MSIPTVSADVNISSTRFRSPLPSHIWHALAVSPTGDGTGGTGQLVVNILSTVPLNVPPASVEEISFWTNNNGTTRPKLFLVYGGDILEQFLSAFGTTGFQCASGWIYNTNVFQGKGKIRPRSPRIPYTQSVLTSIVFDNVNTTIAYFQCWGYLWQIPESDDPWHPMWGAPK